MAIKNSVTLKSEAKLELLFNEPASGVYIAYLEWLEFYEHAHSAFVYGKINLEVDFSVLLIFILKPDHKRMNTNWADTFENIEHRRISARSFCQLVILSISHFVDV